LILFPEAFRKRIKEGGAGGDGYGDAIDAQGGS
jgi:hypothetical protein